MILKKMFGPQRLSIIVLCLKQLFHTTCDKNRDIEMHINTIQIIANKLKILSRLFLDTDLAVIILTSLLILYSLPINLIDYTKDKDIDINHIITYIYNHSCRYKQ